jgi:hypothetical protein
MTFVWYQPGSLPKTKVMQPVRPLLHDTEGGLAEAQQEAQHDAMQPVLT